MLFLVDAAMRLAYPPDPEVMSEPTLQLRKQTSIYSFDRFTLIYFWQEWPA